MPTVNLPKAQDTLPDLVTAVESGREAEIIISRNGNPAARLVPIRPRPGQRIGVAEGLFPPIGDIDAYNAEIQALFEGRAL